MIVAHALTEATVDDATTGIDLIEATDGHVASVTADTAYDTIAFYDAGWCAGRARRGSTRQDGKSVLAATAVKRSRSYDQRGEG